MSTLALTSPQRDTTGAWPYYHHRDPLAPSTPIRVVETGSRHLAARTIYHECDQVYRRELSRPLDDPRRRAATESVSRAHAALLECRDALITALMGHPGYHCFATHAVALQFGDRGESISLVPASCPLP